MTLEKTDQVKLLYYIIHLHFDGDGDFDGYEVTPFFTSLEDLEKFHRHELPLHHYNEKDVLEMKSNLLDGISHFVFNEKEILGLYKDERSANEKQVIMRELDKKRSKISRIHIIANYRDRYSESYRVQLQKILKKRYDTKITKRSI